MITGKSRTRIKAARAMIVCVLAVCVVIYAFGQQANVPDRCESIARPPRIQPDYSGVVLPPNIAPLNFLVKEDAVQYRVVISSQEGQPIEVVSRSPKIKIPLNPWHALLQQNLQADLHFNVFIKTRDDRWARFQRITNKIANDKIDQYLIYRRIHPAHVMWRKMGVYERNLQNFDESPILSNGFYKDGCLNCHSFCNNRTDKMLLHIRSSEYGSSALLIQDGAPQKIGTKFGYTSWHPSGRLAAYSVNKVTQFFHASQQEVRDVIDLDSLIAYYSLDKRQTKTAPQLSKKDRLETYPAWSADGRYLYFCSAPLTWTDRNALPETWDKIKYDLVRVSYDLNTDSWGEIETVLAAKQTGLSALLPRISPDGRWLLFCMCDYGCFPVYRRSSDLYMLDLEAARQTGRYEPARLDISSDESESWHSFSSNSRWIAFSSKRNSGAFTRIYLSYIDSEGRAHKPLVLPQKDPTYYNSCLWTFSVPELVIEPVRARKEKLGRIVRSSSKIPEKFPVTAATPKAGSLPMHEEPWLGQRE